MSRWLKVVRWLVVVLFAGFLVLQLNRPAKTNPAIATGAAIESNLNVPPQVASILERSCNDCHTNNTRWPWYSHVAPVSWFVIDHVNHGRSHLNFSEWQRYNRREADGLLTAICKEVKSGQMPLNSYTPLHPQSRLSAADIEELCDWTRAARTELEKR